MSKDFSYIKAYDIRGLVPDEISEEDMEQIGAAFVHVLSAERLLLGRDMRSSSPDLAAAFTAGARRQGADVVDIGLVSVDMLYYASGVMSLPGAMITASHNPGAYNGVKFCRAQAAPFGQDSGLDELGAALKGGVPAPSRFPGQCTHADVTGQFGEHLRGLVPLGTGRKLRAVFDAGNGMGGVAVPAVIESEFCAAHGITMDPLYFELDGTFPNHEANPLVPENLEDLRNRVVATGADVGFAFDGDADRCFVVDERGTPVSASTLIAWLASLRLDRHPESVIATNAVASHSVQEAVHAKGGRVVRGRAGHSFMKALMARYHADFGGEHAGHYYFSEFWNADSGVLAAQHVLAALRTQSLPLSEVLRPFLHYVPSGEISIRGEDSETVIRKVEERYAGRPSDWVDGLSIYFDDESWFNLRPSNTEPLIRLNIEARSKQRMRALRDELLTLIDH